MNRKYTGDDWKVQTIELSMNDPLVISLPRSCTSASDGTVNSREG